MTRSEENNNGMMCTTCDNWAALQSGEADVLSKMHLRHVVVTLTIPDRDRMSKVVDDLQPEEASPLQRKLNRQLGEFMDFSLEAMKKTKIAELQEKPRETADLDRRSEIQKELANIPTAMQQVKGKLPKVEVEVYTRDFGDNCYVVNMKGDVKLPEITFAAPNLQACLRNGNAVVFIGLGGNYTEEQLKKALDLFLSEMDARTAFFRN